MNFENELNCKRWERIRGAVLARDQYLDQIKKRFGKRIGADTVHHIFPREYFPEYAFCEWNLISTDGGRLESSDADSAFEGYRSDRRTSGNAGRDPKTEMTAPVSQNFF